VFERIGLQAYAQAFMQAFTPDSLPSLSFAMCGYFMTGVKLCKTRH